MLIGIVGSYHRNGATGGLSQHGRVLDSTTLVDPFGSILLPPQLAASERVGGLCVTRLAMLVAVSVLSVVITEMQGNGLLKSTRKGLGRYNFGGSSSIAAAATEALHLKGSVLVPLLDKLCFRRYQYVGSYHANGATGCSSQHGRVLDSTNLVDPFG
jgi:hypothetical protein